MEATLLDESLTQTVKDTAILVRTAIFLKIFVAIKTVHIESIVKSGSDQCMIHRHS